MEIEIMDATLETVAGGTTTNIDGIVVIDKVGYFIEGHGDEGDRGMNYVLNRKRGTGEEIERIQLMMGGPHTPHEREMYQGIDDELDGIWMQAAHDAAFNENSHSGFVASIRWGRVVGAHVVPIQPEDIE